METTIKITKIKLRDGMFATIDYTVSGEPGVIKVASDVINQTMHDDLRDKITHLDRHCVLINELLEVKKVKGDLDNWEDPILENIKVNTIIISDKADGVTINFSRKLSNGKVIPQNTWFLSFNDEATPYKYRHDLQDALHSLTEEAILYINGKWGAQQLAMDFNAKTDEDAALEEMHM